MLPFVVPRSVLLDREGFFLAFVRLIFLLSHKVLVTRTCTSTGTGTGTWYQVRTGKRTWYTTVYYYTWYNN
jgi:hypothetical protein